LAVTSVIDISWPEQAVHVISEPALGVVEDMRVGVHKIYGLLGEG
jgi:hypothetical protein